MPTTPRWTASIRYSPRWPSSVGLQIRLAYGNWFKTALRSWDADLNRHGFQAIQQSDPVKGEPHIALPQGAAGETGDDHDGAS